MGNSKDVLSKNEASYHNEHGHEVNSPHPAVEIGVISPSDDGDYELNRIRRLISQEMSEVASKRNMETFDEANDFDLEEEDEDFGVETKYMAEEYLDFPPPREDPSLDQDGKHEIPPSQKQGGDSHVVSEANSDQKGVAE